MSHFNYDTKYPYQLKHGSNKKINCPSCGKREFTPYVDSFTGEIISPEFGWCDRQDKCCYHQKPVGYKGKTTESYKVKSKMESQSVVTNKEATQEIAKPYVKPLYDRMPINLDEMPNEYNINHLYRYLCNHFNNLYVQNVFIEYRVKTARFPLKNCLDGAMLLPYINEKGEVLSMKIIAYDAETGKRNRATKVTWLHKVSKLYYKENFNREPSFFGQHLLKQFPTADVYVVESEKTAIISKIVDYTEVGICEITGRQINKRSNTIYLSTGGGQGLKTLLPILRGRKVILLPDNDIVGEKWVTDEVKSLCDSLEIDVSFGHIAVFGDRWGENNKQDYADILMEDIKGLNPNEYPYLRKELYESPRFQTVSASG